MQTIRQMRLAMKLSFGEAAEFCGVPKATYQRYDEGTARVPPEVTEKMTAAWKRDRTWMSGMVKRIEADIDRRFPRGIPSQGGGIV